jgi:hypothetical protein
MEKKLEFKDGLYNGELYILTNNNQSIRVLLIKKK